jgi:hypothetical protein
MRAYGEVKRPATIASIERRNDLLQIVAAPKDRQAAPAETIQADTVKFVGHRYLSVLHQPWSASGQRVLQGKNLRQLPSWSVVKWGELLFEQSPSKLIGTPSSPKPPPSKYSQLRQTGAGSMSWSKNLLGCLAGGNIVLKSTPDRLDL